MLQILTIQLTGQPLTQIQEITGKLAVGILRWVSKQWGSGAPGTITYPIEFTSAFIAIATPANGSPNEIGITNLKTNSFHVENWSSSRPAYNDYWIAIGI